MFGNYTVQPESSIRNGFLALAVFDDPGEGGNGDGVIDDKDKVFPLLRLWLDSNHNGISEASELYSLNSLGVKTISLEFKTSYRIDKNGNTFRYRAKVNGGMHGPSPVGVWAYDVFFVAK